MAHFPEITTHMFYPLPANLAPYVEICVILFMWQWPVVYFRLIPHIVYGSLDNRKHNVLSDTIQHISNCFSHWMTFEKTWDSQKMHFIKAHQLASLDFTRCNWWGKWFKILIFTHFTFYYPPFHMLLKTK